MPITPALSLLLILATSDPASPGPTLAREDTMHTAVPEILISAPRVTLAEILDRVARGEARRDSMLVDQTFTASLRLVRTNRSGEQELLHETVTRVYKKRPDMVRGVILRQWSKQKDNEKKKINVEVNFRDDMSEQVVNFAFRPEARRDFHYRIAGRDLVGDHLIYRIAFDPRSPLDPSEPSGIVWVDTNDFVIVRQEVSFKRSPAPLFIKGIDRMVIERTRVDGYWVLSRVMMRASAALPLPGVGKGFDFTLLFDHYVINHGIDSAFFQSNEDLR